MPAEIVGAVLSFVCLIATAIFTFRMRRMKPTYLFDYQAGLRFDGARCSILSPGHHLSSASSSAITVVDLRPHQFILESQVCKDAMYANCVISLGGEILVSDGQRVVIALKNIVEDSLAIVRETARSVVSHTILEPGPAGRASLTKMLTEEMNRELSPRGVEIRNLEITELWAQPLKYDMPTTTN